MSGVGGFQFDWPYFLGLFASSYLFKAALITIGLATVSWIFGNILGFGIALSQQSRLKILKIPSILFIGVFRGTPLLVQIIILYNAVPILFPFTSPFLANPFVAGAIALTLNTAAFSAEIIRSGLTSVDKGQIEAGIALGMRPVQIMRHIIVKQALRVIIPPAGNEFINALKNTSMVSVISLTELTLAGQHMYTVNYKVIETLIAVGIYYLVLTIGFTLLQQMIERKLDITRNRKAPASLMTRIFTLRAFRRG
jgi:polar amino acid transport system permease protein